MTGAAARRRSFDLAAIAALTIALLCAAGAGAAPRPSLAAQLWAVEATGASAALVATSVRGSRVNALVIDARRATPKQLKAAKRTAARGKLAFIVSSARVSSTVRSARAGVTACAKLRRSVPGVHCAVTAQRIADVRTLVTRPGVKLVVVRLLGPGQLPALRRLKGSARVLALVTLGAKGFNAAGWRSAIAAARFDKRVDLAVAPGASTGSLRRYTSLLDEHQARAEEPPAGAPGAPLDLRVVEAAPASLTVTWSAAPGPPRREYRVYANGVDAGSSRVLSMTVTGLACGRSYRIEVEAVGDEGASPRAALNAATASCGGGGEGGDGGGGGGGGGAGDTQPPSAPTSLAKTAGTQASVTISWSAGADNVAVTGYLVYVDGAAAGSATGTAHAFGGLACGRTYSFGVSARDAAGNVSPRATVSAATSACPGGGTPDVSAPSVPGGSVRTGSTGSSISVSWSASSDNVGVAGYGLYRNGSSTGSTANRSATFSGLACGTSYTLAVDAYDAAGNRSAKASLSAATNACPPPPPPPPPPSSGAASVFLAPNGSDSNPCTQAAPCKTFDRGYRAAAPGALVEIAAGLYPGQQVIPSAAKSGSTPILFRPAAGAAVDLESLDVFGDHVDVGGITIERDFYVKCSADDVVLRNSIAQLLFIRSSSNVSIYDTEFGNVANAVSQIGPGDGCTTPPVNVLLDGVYMHDYYSSPFNSVHEECLMVTGIDGITIRRSKFHRCEDFDILFKRFGTTTMLSNITLENNWFDVPYPDGTSAIQFSPDGDTFTNVLIRNNSFAGTLTLKPGVNYVNTRVIGNVGTRGPCLGSVTSAYNVWSGTDPCSSTDRRAPTGYVNQSGFDFHLTSSAAAIDSAHPTDHPSTDIDGETRPSGNAPDAGADEAG